MTSKQKQVLSNDLDCSFKKNNHWFRLRVAAIIIEDGCLLLASNEIADYYYSIGGAVHRNETAEDAIIREVYEETGVQYKIDRLAFIHENFFTNEGMFKGFQCHEISFYFLMKPRGTQDLNSNSFCLEGKESMNWIPLSNISKLHVFPSFFTTKLNPLPHHVEHIITRE